MIREKLKSDLIKYIKWLTDTDENLEDMRYPDLYAKYIDVLGINPVDVDKIIRETIDNYRKLNPEELIEDEQIIDDTGILEPINYLYLMQNKLQELRKDVEDRKSHLEMYGSFLKDDEQVNLDDESLRSEEKTDILNDLSYERKVVATYPGIIAELETKIAKLHYAISKIDGLYHEPTDDNGRRF